MASKDHRARSRSPILLDSLISASFFPRHGSFVQVCYGDRGLGTFQKGAEGADSDGQALRSLAHTTLLTAGVQAARAARKDRKDRKKALEFGRRVSSESNRMTYWSEFVQFSLFNDTVYTTYGYQRGVNMPNPDGRALRMLPLHCDNQQRLRAGLAPSRNIELGTSDDVSEGILRWGRDPSLSQSAFLWFPEINLKVLWESGGETLTSEGLEWEDGSSKMNPPPSIMSLGFENAPNERAWGKTA